jgi:hypothetical protein
MNTALSCAHSGGLVTRSFEITQCSLLPSISGE